MLRLLYVTYSFPPMAGAGVHRPVKFVKHLKSFGIQTTLITTRRDILATQDFSYQDEIPDSLDLRRIPNPDYSLLARLIEKCGIKRRALSIDPKGRWSHVVQNYIERQCRQNPKAPWDVLLVSAPPFSSFLIAKDCPLPCVLDYRDEASTSSATTDHLTQEKVGELRNLESEVLKQAAGVVTVFSSMTSRIASVADIPEERISIVENGYDEDDFSQMPDQPDSQRFVSTYAGYLYGTRTPEYWWQALASIRETHADVASEMDVRFYGRMSEKFAAMLPALGLDDFVTCFGQVSHREALEALYQAHQLVIISETIPEADDWPTGKIYENMRAGAPLLVTGRQGGAKDQLLRACGAGHTIELDDVAAIKAHILDQFFAWKRGEWKRRPVSDALRQYERKALTEKLARVLYAAAGGGHEMPKDMTIR